MAPPIPPKTGALLLLLLCAPWVHAGSDAVQACPPTTPAWRRFDAELRSALSHDEAGPLDRGPEFVCETPKHRILIDAGPPAIATARGTNLMRRRRRPESFE